MLLIVNSSFFCNMQKFDLRLLSCGAGKHFNLVLLLNTMFIKCFPCSHREPSIVMIVIDVFFSLIITVFGWEHVLARKTIVNSGKPCRNAQVVLC